MWVHHIPWDEIQFIVEEENSVWRCKNGIVEPLLTVVFWSFLKLVTIYLFAIVCQKKFYKNYVRICTHKRANFTRFCSHFLKFRIITKKSLKQNGKKQAAKWKRFLCGALRAAAHQESESTKCIKRKLLKSAYHSQKR